MKRLAFFLLLFFAWPACAYDIIISGGGTGGTSAAIQASRLGMRVLVVESSNMLGGQATAAGVSMMDDMSRIESGIYLEFITRVRDYYSAMGKSIATPYWKSHGKAFEPSVGHKILMDMAASADIIFNAEIVSVKDNTAQIKTPDGMKEFAFKILIDASECGDIIPMMGGRWRSGNSLLPGEIHDKYLMIQDITWTAIIRKYPDGVPEHLKPKEPLPDYERAKKNYQQYVTKNGFDFRGRYPVKLPVNLISHNAYRAVPDSFSKGSYTGERNDWPKISKAGVNWGNDYPGQYLTGRYGMTINYLEDEQTREKMNREALIKTLHFLYYVQNELGENWAVDENEYDFLPEVAKDFPQEWQEVARHMPPIPYVRESRRILGEFTLKAKDIYENSMSYREGNKNKEFYDAIAIGGYTLDLHNSEDDDDIEKSLGERQTSIYQYEPAGAFQVPMRILIPASVDNFIAAEKNLSMSRLAAGALRLQPITMMTGQAAGALAAVAVRENIQPREVNSVYVQKILADNGVRLSLARYSDVPERHPYFPSVQIATLHKLISPVRLPEYPKQRIHAPVSKGLKLGVFGINNRISAQEFSAMIERAEKISGKKISLTHQKNLTKGEAVDMVINAMCE